MRLGVWYDGCCCGNTCVDPCTGFTSGAYDSSFRASHCLFDRNVYRMLCTSRHLDRCFIVVVRNWPLRRNRLSLHGGFDVCCYSRCYVDSSTVFSRCSNYSSLSVSSCRFDYIRCCPCRRGCCEHVPRVWCWGRPAARGSRSRHGGCCFAEDFYINSCRLSTEQFGH